MFQNKNIWISAGFEANFIPNTAFILLSREPDWWGKTIRSATENAIYSKKAGTLTDQLFVFKSMHSSAQESFLEILHDKKLLFKKHCHLFLNSSRINKGIICHDNPNACDSEWLCAVLDRNQLLCFTKHAGEFAQGLL